MYGPQLVQFFLDAVDSWVCEDYALDVRYVAQRVHERWEIVDALVTLLPVPNNASESVTVNTAQLRAARFQIFPISKADALKVLTAAVEGKIEHEGTPLTLPYEEELDTHSEMTHQDRWFCPLHLKVSTRRVAPINPGQIASLDAALRRAQPPFDGTADLNSFLGLSTAPSGTTQPAITIAVAPPVDLIYDATSLTDGHLRAALNAHPNLDLTRIGLSVRAAPGIGLAGRQQIAGQVTWSDSVGHRRAGLVEISLPKSDSVLTMVSLGDETVRRQWIMDPHRARNFRYLSISQFDSELRMLRQALFDAPESRKFEQAVATLLYILGFSAAISIETDAPDLVLATPAGQAVIVECTTRIADFATKAGKLVERRAALLKTLSATGLPAGVFAILVCRLPRDQIAASAKDLAEREILLISAEELESTLTRARFGIDVDAFLKEEFAALRTAGLQPS